MGAFRAASRGTQEPSGTDSVVFGVGGGVTVMPETEAGVHSRVCALTSLLSVFPLYYYF